MLHAHLQACCPSEIPCMLGQGTASGRQCRVTVSACCCLGTNIFYFPPQVASLTYSNCVCRYELLSGYEYILFSPTGCSAHLKQLCLQV